MIMRYLYLVKIDWDWDYDEFDAFIISAKDEKEDRKISGEKCIYVTEKFEKESLVKRIGITTLKKGVILGSFNAG